MAALADAGFTVNEAAIRFFGEFSGLTVVSEKGDSSVWIDSEEAAADADPGWCRAYAVALGRPLLPVGGQSHMTILIDPDGLLWGGFDYDYGYLGDSLRELVHGLLVDSGGHRMFDRSVPGRL